MRDADETISLTLSRFRRACLYDGGFSALTISLVIAGLTIRISPWLLLIIPAVFVFFLCRALLNAPSRATCAALLDDASHAGGYYLTSSLPGSDAWIAPLPIQPRVPRIPIRRYLALSLAALFFGGMLALPDEWFAPAEIVNTKPSLSALTAELKNELDSIDEDTLEDAQELNSLKDELTRIEEAADPTDPAATIEAVERLNARVKALLDLDAETIKRMLPETAIPDATALASEAQQAFKDMIDQSGMGVSLQGEEEREDGAGEGDGGEGEGEGIGSGEIARGRDDAQMTWGKERTLNDSHLSDRSEMIEPASSEIITVGESISTEDPALGHTTSRAASSDPNAESAPSLGLTRRTKVAPRYRRTVKRYFETERTTP